MGNGLIPYVGSKKMILKKLEPLFPRNIKNYFEPFVGGGSVLFYLNQTRDIEKNYINDINKDLINVYKVIKNDSRTLIEYLTQLNKIRSRKDYNMLVKVYNEHKTEKSLLAAIYIFLAKRSFNGQLYMKSNKLNPYYAQSLSKNNIIDENYMNELVDLLDDTTIYNKSYDVFVNHVTPQTGDFVFFDPPYLVDKIKEYYEETFDLENFKELKKVCDKLDKQGVRFMLTLNKNTALKKLFEAYEIKHIKKFSRMSNGKVNEYEMVIRNYS